MKRLGATLWLDVRLQARNRVYLVIAAITVAVGFTLGSLFSPEQLRFWMPILVLGGTTATTVFLVGMLLQLERAQGMLDAVLLSPLRPGEYLASKMISLVGLALVESGLLVGLAFGGGVRVHWLVLAVLLRAALGVAVGVAIGVRFDSFLRWLPPVVFVSMAFDLPVFCHLFDLWSSPFFYLHPALPSLALAKAAFLPVDSVLLSYAVAYGVVAVVVATWWAMKSMQRFVLGGDPT